MKKGYLFCTNRNYYFFETEYKKLTSKFLDHVIIEMCKKLNKNDDFITLAVNNPGLRNDTKRRLNACTIETKTGVQFEKSGGGYYSIQGNDFLFIYPFNDCDDLVFM